jgi:hypothetical protein
MKTSPSPLQLVRGSPECPIETAFKRFQTAMAGELDARPVKKDIDSKVDVKFGG